MRLMKLLRSTEEQQNFTDNMQGLEMFKKNTKPKDQTNQEVRTTLLFQLLVLWTKQAADI